MLQLLVFKSACLGLLFNCLLVETLVALNILLLAIALSNDLLAFLADRRVEYAVSVVTSTVRLRMLLATFSSAFGSLLNSLLVERILPVLRDR